LMAGPNHHPAAVERVLIQLEGGVVVSNQPQGHGQVVSRTQGSPVVFPELILEAAVGLPVDVQGFPVFAQCLQISAQIVGGDQREQVVVAEFLPLPPQDKGVQSSSLIESPLETQDVRDLGLQVQR